MKIIIGAGRKRGLTAAQAHRHAVTRHAPLALAAPDADAFAHYQINQIIDGAYGADAPGPFDIVAEDTFTDADAMMRMSGSEYFQTVIAPDEAEFGDLATRVFFLAREEVLRHPQPARERDALKALFFLIRKSDADAAHFRQSWQALDASIPSAVLGAVRNLPDSPPPALAEAFAGPPAYDGVMALWAEPAGALEEFDAYWADIRAIPEIDQDKSFYVIGKEAVFLS